MQKSHWNPGLRSVQSIHLFFHILLDSLLRGKDFIPHRQFCRFSPNHKRLPDRLSFWPHIPLGPNSVFWLGRNNCDPTGLVFYGLRSCHTYTLHTNTCSLSLICRHRPSLPLPAKAARGESQSRPPSPPPLQPGTPKKCNLIVLTFRPPVRQTAASSLLPHVIFINERTNQTDTQTPADTYILYIQTFRGPTRVKT